MSTKSIEHEEQMIDLMQKLLIVELYNSGVKRDDIKKILSVSSNKVSSITKFLKVPRRRNNE